MRKRFIAGILTVVMTVSSLQFQTVNVMAKELYQETTSIMEDVDTESEIPEEKAAAESSDEGTESEKQEEESNEEDSKENEMGSDTKGEIQENEAESAATEDVGAESESTEEEMDVEDAEKDRTDETEIGTPGAEMSLTTSDTDIASGTYTENGSNVAWVIDANGKLTVEGTGDFADPSSTSMNRAPWYSERSSIISAEIKVTDMTNASHMFQTCNNMTSVDLSGLDTSKVTNMSYMFADCHSLDSLNLSGFNTSKVTDMSYMFKSCALQSNPDLSSWDTGNVTDMSGMFLFCGDLTSVDLGGLNTGKVTDMSDMFSGCHALTSVDLRGLNTGKVTSMNNMFASCARLTSVNLSGLNTSNVTDMYMMFDQCYYLKNIDLSGLSTGKEANLSEMFFRCSSLTSIDLSGFDTSNVANMSSMFSLCPSLTSLDLGGLNTGNVTDMSKMFSSCTALTSLDLSGLNTGNVTNMSQMFSGCTRLASVNLSGLNTGKEANLSNIFRNCTRLDSVNLDGFDTVNVANMSGMFYQCSNLTDLDVSGFKTDNVTNMSSMFYQCSNLTGLDVSGFKTDNVTNMSSMFYQCKKLANLDVSDFETGNVTNMSDMFYYCNSLTSLDVSGFKTGNVTDMSDMFYHCNSLTSLDVSGFKTGNVTNMSDMFYYCPSLTSLDVSGFKTDNVTNMSGMFYYCTSLTSLDVSGFKTDNVTDMSSMFYQCSNLTGLDVSGFKTGNVTNMSCMFYYCNSLTGLDVSGFKTDNVTNMSSMFHQCSNLTGLDVSGFKTGNVTNMNSMFSLCGNLTNLDLSNFDTSKVTAMVNMMYHCYNLTIIYTPYNLTQVVKLPYNDNPESSDENQIWYGSNGTEYTELPQNLGYSIVIMKGKIPSVYTVTFTGTGKDDITEGTPNEVAEGADYTFMLVKSEGYTYTVTATMGEESVTISPDETGNTYTIPNVSANLVITIEKTVELPPEPEKKTYTVTFTGTGKDDITEGTLNEVTEDTDYTFKLVKSEGYTYTVTATMGEEPITISPDETGNTYIIPSVSGNLVITIEKTVELPPEPEKKTCTVTFTGTGKDDITEGTLNEVTEGTAYTFTLVKSEGYTYTVTATMGEVPITLSPDETGNTYTISNVTANLVITIEKTAELPPEPEDKSGLKIWFANDNDKKSVYTGSAIQPEIRVTYNGKRLISGIDYTVKYSNNIKVGNAGITVTGKGNFVKGDNTTIFEIVARNIADVTLCGVATDAANKESLTLASGSTLIPTLYYNNIKLTNKDYVIKDAGGTEISGKKLGDSDNNTTIKIEGKSGGNFTGSREVTLNVVAKKNLTKFTVAVDKTKLNTLTYDGSRHYIHDISGAITVTAKNADKTNMLYGRDYTIVYPSDIISAGTKKFTVVGLGLYTGNVSKSYTIKPAKEERLEIKYDGRSIAGNKINAPFTFASAGVTFGNKLTVINSNGNELSEGRDYKVAYSGNKKVGANAKCTVTFLGNYKGHAKQIVEFEITKADLSKAEVIVADKAYTGKEGIYKSAPYVIEDKDGANVLVKSSNYKTTYYTQDPTNNDSAAQMKGKNKVGAGATVWVKLEAKGGNYSGTKIVSYKVREAQDLSKAKITFKDASGNTVNKMPYTGSKITDKQIKAVVDGNLAENDTANIEVIYVNNINKGKATVIIKGTDTENCKYAGCKTATFSIVARSFGLD